MFTSRLFIAALVTACLGSLPVARASLVVNSDSRFISAEATNDPLGTNPQTDSSTASTIGTSYSNFVSDQITSDPFFASAVATLSTQWPVTTPNSEQYQAVGTAEVDFAQVPPLFMPNAQAISQADLTFTVQNTGL